MSHDATPHPPIAGAANFVLPSSVALSPQTAEAARRLGVWNQVQTAIGIAQELFPGPLRIEVEEDRELDSGERLVFFVQASGEPGEIADRHVTWAFRIVKLSAPAPKLFFLSIDVRE